MELYLLIILPILLSLLLLVPSEGRLPRMGIRLAAFLIHCAMLAAAMRLFYRARFGGEVITASLGGEKYLGIALRCDLTAACFLVLVTFLFVCVYIYQLPAGQTRLFSFLMTVLEGLLVLLFLSRDLFNIYVAVEVATIVCSILIMFRRESRSIYDGLVYLLSNIVGMLFFLLGIGVLYRQTGVLDMGAIREAIGNMTAREAAFPFALLMTGALLKCAVFPFHFWLPHAHGTPGAPTVVSAVLSGVYVKAGLYLFIRLRDMFQPVLQMDQFYLWLGVFTALLGIIMAVCQKDMKLILAYHTISQVGLILAGLNMDSQYAQEGGMLHIFNHALFKTLLFLAAGRLIDTYRTRSVYQVHGVFRTLPLVGTAIAAGILGITGAPFFNGSISKYLIQKGGASLTAELFLLLINFGTCLSFVKFGQILLGKKEAAVETRQIYANSILIVLSALCLLTGIFAAPVMNYFFNAQLQVDALAYLEKCGIWAASMGLAWLVYRRILSKIPRLKEGIPFSVGFPSICICTCAGFLGQLGAALSLHSG